jgi:hypothetical protein
VQWSTSPSFASYDVVRAAGTSVTIPADWFAGRTTYYVRIFEMSPAWLRGPHTNENVTGHSNVIQFTLPDRPAGFTRLLAWAQRGSDIDGATDNEIFGSSVSMSDDGTVVAVGAPNAGSGSEGAVRVFAWSGTAWEQRGTSFTGLVNGDRLGTAVAISSGGDYLAMSAPLLDGLGTNRGRVWIHNWDGSSWNWIGNAINGDNDNDELGQALAISSDGTIVAISSTDGYAGAGYVSIFDYTAGSWVARTEIQGSAGDRIGQSVALSEDGTFLAIGAPLSTNRYVVVLRWTGSWNFFGSTLYGGGVHEFGRSLALSADGLTLAIGSPTAPGGGTERGLTRVFRWGGSSWSQLGTDINGIANNDQSGWSVALSDDGNTVAIGSRLADDAGNASGTTRVYQWSSTLLEWILDTTFIGEAANDQSGHSVSISANGRVVAIGALYNSAAGSQRGHVRVYSYE